MNARNNMKSNLLTIRGDWEECLEMHEPPRKAHDYRRGIFPTPDEIIIVYSPQGVYFANDRGIHCFDFRGNRTNPDYIKYNHTFGITEEYIPDISPSSIYFRLNIQNYPSNLRQFFIDIIMNRPRVSMIEFCYIYDLDREQFVS